MSPTSKKPLAPLPPPSSMRLPLTCLGGHVRRIERELSEASLALAMRAIEILRPDVKLLVTILDPLVLWLQSGTIEKDRVMVIESLSESDLHALAAANSHPSIYGQLLRFRTEDVVYRFALGEIPDAHGIVF